MMLKKSKAELLISIVVFKESDQFVAQGLEHDICVQAPSIPELLKRFERVALASFFVCEKEELDFSTSFPPAPREFWDMFEKARARGPALGKSTRENGDMPLIIPQIRYMEGLAA